MPFSAFIQSWHDFFIVAGSSSATLVALMFVGLSLHLETVITRIEVRTLARVTMANFVLALLVSLFTVIPQGAENFSIELLISGLVSLVLVMPSLVRSRRSRTRTLPLPRLLLRFGSSTLAYAGIVAAGILVRQGAYDTALGALVAAIVTLLILSLRNSWDLLVSVGEAVREKS